MMWKIHLCNVKQLKFIKYIMGLTWWEEGSKWLKDKHSKGKNDWSDYCEETEEIFTMTKKMNLPLLKFCKSTF